MGQKKKKFVKCTELELVLFSGLSFAKFRHPLFESLVSLMKLVQPASVSGKKKKFNQRGVQSCEEKNEESPRSTYSSPKFQMNE
jgi:hypothetical protein